MPPSLPRRPALSVVVPVYGTEAFLPDCLDSILSQTFTDFEVVAVDDASPDRCPAILEDYAARDPRLRIHTNRRNRNLFETRRRGLVLARGEYLVVCDSDDRLLPNALDTLWQCARRENADVVHARTLEEGGRRSGKPFYYADPFRCPDGREWLAAMLAARRGWNMWGKLYRRDTVVRCLGSFLRGRNWFLGEDLLYSVVLAARCRRYVGMSVPVYGYRYPVASPTREKENTVKSIRDFTEITAEVASFVGGLKRPELLWPLRSFLADATGTGRRLPRVLSPSNHVGRLFRCGVREYRLYLLDQAAHAGRLGMGGVLKRVIGGG